MRGHPTSLEIGAFLEHGLEDDERRRVAAHLAECDDCRTEMVDAGRARRAGRKPSRRTWTIGLAAAAVLGLLVVQPWGGGKGELPSADSLRDAPVSAVRPSIEVVDPVHDARPGRPALFIWRSAGPDAVYRFMLTSETGEVLHEATTSDTLLRLPDELALDGDETFYWLVDALLPDGRTASTGARPLHPGP